MTLSKEALIPSTSSPFPGPPRSQDSSSWLPRDPLFPDFEIEDRGSRDTCAAALTNVNLDNWGHNTQSDKILEIARANEEQDDLAKLSALAYNIAAAVLTKAAMDQYQEVLRTAQGDHESVPIQAGSFGRSGGEGSRNEVEMKSSSWVHNIALASMMKEAQPTREEIMAATAPGFAPMAAAASTITPLPIHALFTGGMASDAAYKAGLEDPTAYGINAAGRGIGRGVLQGAAGGALGSILGAGLGAAFMPGDTLPALAGTALGSIPATFHGAYRSMKNVFGDIRRDALAQHDANTPRPQGVS